MISVAKIVAASGRCQNLYTNHTGPRWGSFTRSQPRLSPSARLNIWWWWWW